MKKLIIMFSIALLSLNVTANNPNPTNSELQRNIQTNTMLLNQLKAHLIAINSVLAGGFESIHKRLDPKTKK